MKQLRHLPPKKNIICFPHSGVISAALHMRRWHNHRRTDARHCSPAIIPAFVLRGNSPVRLLLVNTFSPVLMVADPSVLRKPELHPVEIQLPRRQDQEQRKYALREDVEDAVEYRFRVDLDLVTTL